MHWILFGLFGQVTATVCPTLLGHFGAPYAGRAGTANTLVVLIGIFALQSAMGAINDLWPCSTAGAYPAHAYQAAFAVVLAVLVVGLAWLVRPGQDRDAALARVV